MKPLRNNRICLALGLLLAACALPFAGCGGGGAGGAAPQERLTEYGTRRGLTGLKSLNGLGALSKLCEAAGHKVSSWDRISPHVTTFDAVIWAPDSFEPPNEEQRKFFQDWLWQAEEPRTLVYVGRDHDAAIAYLRRMAAETSGTRAAELAKQAGAARQVIASRRSRPEEGYAGWLVLEKQEAERKAEPLTGPWTRELDLADAEIEVGNRFLVPKRSEIPSTDRPESPRFDTLLNAGADPLVTRLTWDFAEGEVLVVTNGSFLLNGALVNHAHRRLAERLVEELGPEPRSVLFLETNSATGEVLEAANIPGMPTGFEALVQWPIGLILMHLIVLGILGCFAVFPIFGRPRDLPREPLGDFGKHIDALGRLLATGGDEAHARRRLEHYREHVKGKG